MARQDRDPHSNLLFHMLSELDAQLWARSGSVCTSSLLRRLAPLSDEGRAKAATTAMKEWGGRAWGFFKGKGRFWLQGSV